jgi:hypothetical protein
MGLVDAGKIPTIINKKFRSGYFTMKSNLPNGVKATNVKRAITRTKLVLGYINTRAIKVLTI